MTFGTCKVGWYKNTVKSVKKDGQPIAEYESNKEMHFNK